MGTQVISKIAFVCSDMWEPYLKVIREKCSEALWTGPAFWQAASFRGKGLDTLRKVGIGRFQSVRAFPEGLVTYDLDRRCEPD